MSSEDIELFSKRLRVENKVLFVDLRKNSTGVYLKLSERRGDKRNSIIIPARGIEELRDTLSEVHGTSSPPAPAKRATKEPAAVVSSAPGAAGTAVVRVGNLSFNTTEEGLANHFKAIGAVVRATIMFRNSKAGTQVSSGRGSVEFKNAAAAASAVEKLNSTSLDGRPISVFQTRGSDAQPATTTTATAAAAPAPAAAAEPRVATNKVFVRNLAWETTDEDLESLFSRVGEVKSATVRKSRAGRSLGQGIVEFADVATATEAVERLNNSELDGRAIALRPFYDNAP